MQPTFLLLLFTLLTPFLYFGQDSDILQLSKLVSLNNNARLIPNTDSSKTLNHHNENRSYSLGFQLGSHSPNQNLNSTPFKQGIYLDTYLKLALSDEIHFLIAFNYWQSKIEESSTPIVSRSLETVDSKGVKLSLDFYILQINQLSLTLGPSLSLENYSKTTSSVFSFGADAKLFIPIWDNNLNLVTSIGYQTGAEALNFGGGEKYSFFTYMIGAEVNISKLFMQQ